MRINRAVACFLCFSQPECAPCLVELCLRCSASPAAGERLAGVHIAHTAQAHTAHWTHNTLRTQHIADTHSTHSTQSIQSTQRTCTHSTLHTEHVHHTQHIGQSRGPRCFAHQPSLQTGLRQAGCVNLSQIYRLHLHYRKLVSVIIRRHLDI